ncbi:MULTISPECIES: SDR family NAD(P)-dependent oxidoreductase [unclassified Wenzhouxiangella]|uniref:SDR family NAD(P)-dependent oxidoreductase n=1 Tax=unclassified Wenzhouxiangella TaxID=2613841 RepID=UPI000E32AB60|nr:MULTISPECIES: SDR family NAD(P)-dependent oxidoreductase [unclassified Wenzhouxiangella]RFF28318.1 SDR family NAD(P)-dependent oxidoreductase [Wenzhouxiangella sp. 15181]RFP67757.1 SDR family NAD(P)-dependent oxidoreductase [Wenzhouxiangella sp. 15190]
MSTLAENAAMDESTKSHHTALITGGASGLGAAMARRFHQAGWSVVVADRDAEGARSFADELGERASDLAMDVTRWEDWEHAREQVGEVDVLINNAGVAVGGSLEETPLEDWQWVMDIDLMGVVAGCKAFVPGMRERGRGHIINVASFAGLAGAPQINAYGTAKAAVIAMSEMLRTELAPAGVHVSVLCPAFVRTRLTETMRAPDSGYHKRVERWMDKSGVSAEDVSETVYRAVEKPRFMLLTHANTRWLWRLKRWFPNLYFRLMMRGVRRATRR